MFILYQGLVQCYLDLDNVNTALNFVRGALDKQPDFGNMLLEMQAEPLWRLGQYEELDVLLKKPDLARNNSWGVEVGRALLTFKEGTQSFLNNHFFLTGRKVAIIYTVVCRHLRDLLRRLSFFSLFECLMFLFFTRHSSY